MSFRRPDWENPEIDNANVDESNPANLQQEYQTLCAPSVCAPEPGVWTWGPPVPSPSLRKTEKKD